MADHLHKQIREAVKTRLTGLTTSGTKVYANRLHPMADANLPGLRIALDSEESSGLTVHQPSIQERRLSLVVECCAKATTAAPNIDDTIDLMSKEVESALAAGITVGSRSLDVFYSGMQFDDELSDRPVGVKRLTFSIPFSAMSNAPDTLV